MSANRKTCALVTNKSGCSGGLRPLHETFVGINLYLGKEYADTFSRGLRAGYVLANGSMSSNESGESKVDQQWRTKYDPAN